MRERDRERQRQRETERDEEKAHKEITGHTWHDMMGNVHSTHH